MYSICNMTTSSKQEFFYNMLIGVLLYSVVLGFFNDYTDIIHTSSYSVTFMLAFVMQILTYITFIVKDRVVSKFSGNKGLLIFSVWLVIFLSKFVFLWAIELVFSKDVEISGFFGILVVIASFTIIQKLIDLLLKKLS